MAALANWVGFGTDHPAPLFSVVSARIGTMLRRTARARYAEQREKLDRNGSAGMI